MNAHSLLRIDQIVGNPKKGIEGIIPVCKASWWNGVKAGRYPAPVKLGANTVAWRAADVLKLVESGVPSAGPSNVRFAHQARRL